MNPWEMNLTSEETPKVNNKEISVNPWELNTPEEPKKERKNSGLGDMRSMSLAGALKGTEQSATPFSTPKEPSTPSEPSLDLINQSNIQGKYNQEDITALETKRKAEEARANAENLYSRYSTMGNKLISSLSTEARKKAEEDNQLVLDKTLEEIRAQGIPVISKNDKIYTVDDSGNEVQVDDVSLLRSMYKSKAEILGSLTGGVVGGAIGGTVGTAAGPVGTVAGLTTGRVVGTAAGALVGSAIGAYTGAGIDGLLTKLDMASKVKEGIIYEKMKDAGIADLVMGEVGLGVGKVAVGVGNTVKDVFNFVVDKNQKGAVDAMVKHMGIDEAEAMQRVKDLEDLIGPLEGMKDGEKILYTLTQTQRGGEAVAQAAVNLDPLASTRLANIISKRAEDTLNLAEDLSTSNNQYIFNQAINNYEKEVKSYYKAVKDSASEFTQDYKFNLDDLNLNEVIDNIENGISNPFVKQKFSDTSKIIKDSYEGSTFNDLIDLRQAINDVKFNGPKLKREDSEVLDNIMARINKEIDDTAKTHIPNSEIWLDNWSKSLKEYTDMKKNMSNVMYKALTRPGISEDQVVNIFSKYIAAGDNTFYQVMEKLPKNVQNRVEGSVLNKLVNKFADGIEGSRRVIHFPGLASELQKVSWQSPKTKQLVRTINRMADVFKNDVHLAAVSGKIQLPKFQSYLTADPVIRMKMEIASSVFNTVKQYMPTQSADTLAMANHVGRLLENPVSDKAVKDLLGSMPKERRAFRGKLDFEPDLKELQQAYIARKMAMQDMFKKDIPPRLVWKASPENLSKLQNPEATILPSVDEVLHVSSRGNVGTSKNAVWDYESQQTLNTRASDLITEFIWRNTQGKGGEAITEQAMKYMEDARFTKVMQNVNAKLVKGETEQNAKIVANSIKTEAGILIKRIEKDFGVKLPKGEADKLVALKYKEIMESCNVK